MSTTTVETGIQEQQELVVVHISEPDERIILNIAGQHGDDLCFRVRLTTLIGRLKKNYSERTGLPLSSIEFLVNSRKMSDDDTPERLHLKNYDSIKVIEKYTAYRRVLLSLEHLDLHSTHFEIFNRNEMTDNLVLSCLGPADAAALDKLFVKLADRIRFTREFSRICAAYDNDGRQKKEHVLWTSMPSLEQPSLEQPSSLAIEWRNDSGSESHSFRQNKRKGLRPNPKRSVPEGIKTEDEDEEEQKEKKQKKSHKKKKSNVWVIERKKRSSTSGKQGTRYSQEEEEEMLRYVCENGKYYDAQFTRMWTEAKEKGLFPNRSAGGLVAHFRIIILTNLDRFDFLSLKDLTEFHSLGTGTVTQEENGREEDRTLNPESDEDALSD